MYQVPFLPLNIFLLGVMAALIPHEDDSLAGPQSDNPPSPPPPRKGRCEAAR